MEAAELITTAFAILITAALVYGIYWIVQWVNRRNQNAWREVAAQVNGTFTPPTGPWYNRKVMNIQAIIDGVPVLVDSYVVSTGKSSTTYTRLRTSVPGTQQFQLGVSKEGFFSSLGKALGGQDIQLGDPSFDQAAVIKSSDEDMARAWLNEEARAALLPALHYSYQLQNGELKAIKVGLDTQPESLVPAIQAVAALARGGVQIGQRWEELARVLGGTLRAQHGTFAPDGGASIDFDLRGVHLSIDAPREFSGWIFKSSRIYTRISARILHPHSPFALYLGDTPPHAQALPEALPPRELGVHYKLRAQEGDATLAALEGATTARLLRGLPELLYSDDTHLYAVFSGLLTEPSRLQPVVEALLELASAPPRAPYR